MAQLGATAQFVHVSRGARELHSSRTTSTVQDVQWGVAHIGAGGYVTMERLALVPFSTAYQIRQFYLCVPKPSGDDTLGKQMMQAFAPFKPEVYILLTIVPFVLGLVNALIRATGPRDDDDDGTSSPAGLGFYLWSTGKKEAWAASFDLINGYSQDIPSSLPMRVAGIGTSFFAMIVLASFTANLAAFLTIRRQGDYVQSMNVAISRGWTIC